MRAVRLRSQPHKRHVTAEWNLDDPLVTAGVSRGKLYDLIRRGEVVSVRIGGSRRIPREGLECYLRDLTEAAAVAAQERRQDWSAHGPRQPVSAGLRGLSLPA